MKNKMLISIGMSIAVAILILGLIHNIATFTPLIRDGLSCLTAENMNAMIYMSLMCGTSLVLCGILLLVMLKRIEQVMFFCLPIVVIGIYLALNGILSIAFMVDNPFAWVALLLNLSMFAVTIKLRMDITKEITKRSEISLQH